MDAVSVVTRSFPQHRCRDPAAAGGVDCGDCHHLAPEQSPRPTERDRRRPRGALGVRAAGMTLGKLAFHLCWAWSSPLFGHKFLFSTKHSSLQEYLLGGVCQSSFLGGWVWVRGHQSRSSAFADLVSPSRRAWPTCSTLDKPGSRTGRCEFWQDEALHADCCFSSCEEDASRGVLQNVCLDLECKYCRRGSERD